MEEAAHDLRGPLTNICAFLYLLAEEGELSPIQLDRIEKINQLIAYESNLIDELLHLTVSENNKFEMSAVEVDIEELVAEIKEHFIGFVEKKQQKLIVKSNLAGNRIYSNKLSIYRILKNLLSNAIIFSKPHKSIILHTYTHEGKVNFSIKDQGPGFTVQDQGQMFEKFKKLSANPTNGEDCVGLGLYIVKNLTNSLGGTIEVVTEADVGTEFIVSLPNLNIENNVKKRSESDLIFGEESETGSELFDAAGSSKKDRSPFNLRPNSRTHHKPWVLLIEDGPDTQRYIGALLETKYRISYALDGKAAFDQISKVYPKAPALIISDIIMPGMDGLTFAQEIKKSFPDRRIPFVFLTSRSDKDSKLKGLRVGVDDYITKPFEEEELLARINNLISNSVFRSKTSQRAGLVGENKVDPSNLPVSYLDELLIQLQREVDFQIANPNLSVEFLAEAVNMHRKTLTRTLKRASGLTPGKFIRYQRLYRALQYLEAGTYSTINEVTRAVGFESPSNFSQAFYKRYGKKPSEYLAKKSTYI